ncbi:hypothetical protein [Lacipirellula parvula]|uniref:Uncharacterized protein n=1 Tax=Lacipirellula parvula TaxID=2650471 RepID=A0A5K7XIH9_9BACT|nr:hypothetical protein [Lacipirellula parvula]BBO36268.1 hypothetical protein PLANPX_5880 [Lacipirellula parvula]
MSPDTQRQLLATLAETLALAPDVRFGQLIAHLGFLGEDSLDRGLSDLEDDELLAVLYRHRAELLARQEGDATAGPPAPSAVVSISGSEISPSPSPGVSS